MIEEMLLAKDEQEEIISKLEEDINDSLRHIRYKEKLLEMVSNGYEEITMIEARLGLGDARKILEIISKRRFDKELIKDLKNRISHFPKSKFSDYVLVRLSEHEFEKLNEIIIKHYSNLEYIIEEFNEREYAILSVDEGFAEKITIHKF